MSDDLTNFVERSLMKTFKGAIYSKFCQAIDDYDLISEGDKIGVAISGGKDSLLMAKLFQAYEKYGSVKFEAVYFTMDPGYLPEIAQKHKTNCEILNIPVLSCPSNTFAAAAAMNPEKPCFLCARMRRGFLYKKAKELGCNKLALGHHFDDVIETTLLNIFYAGCFKTMLPKTKSENYENMELIRPMYYIKERDCERFAAYHKIEALKCECPASMADLDSKRKEMKKLIAEMREKYVNSDINIFRSAENVNLKSILGYHIDEEKHSFQDDY